MPRTQEKKKEQEEIQEQEEMVGQYISDVLVLRVACHDIENLESECYVYYDYVEKEYFVCGLKENESNPYKFYTKKRTNIMDFMDSILGNNCQVSIELMNYPNLFVNNYYVDYDVLTHDDTEWSEISCVQGTSYTCDMRFELYRCLKSLKFVRW